MGVVQKIGVDRYRYLQKEEGCSKGGVVKKYARRYANSGARREEERYKKNNGTGGMVK